MNQSRGASTAQISRKRKDLDNDDFFLPRHYQVHKAKKPPKTTSSSPVLKPVEPVFPNRILAGYMAHEFLTNGTLLGHMFDPARARPHALTPAKTYSDVASLLTTDGAHIPGIVNPGQLARWIQK